MLRPSTAAAGYDGMASAHGGRVGVSGGEFAADVGLLQLWLIILTKNQVRCNSDRKP